MGFGLNSDRTDIRTYAPENFAPDGIGPGKFMLFRSAPAEDLSLPSESSLTIVTIHHIDRGIGGGGYSGGSDGGGGGWGGGGGNEENEHQGGMTWPLIISIGSVAVTFGGAYWGGQHYHATHAPQDRVADTLHARINQLQARNNTLLFGSISSTHHQLTPHSRIINHERSSSVAAIQTAVNHNNSEIHALEAQMPNSLPLDGYAFGGAVTAAVLYSACVIAAINIRRSWRQMRRSS